MNIVVDVGVCFGNDSKIILLLANELHQVASSLANKVLYSPRLFADESKCSCFGDVLQDLLRTTANDGIKVLCVFCEKGRVDEHCS